MKIHLKFDHSKVGLLEAIDSEHRKADVDKMLAEIMAKLMFSDNLERVSEVCELVHDSLDYEVILYLATHYVLAATSDIAKRYEGF